MPMINETNQDIEIEQYLLAGLLENNLAIFEIDLQSNDFYAPQHQHLFAKMQDLMASQSSFDYATLYNWVKGQKFIDEDDESGEQYIKDLQDCCITSNTNNLINYANILKDFAIKRRIGDGLEQARGLLDNPDIPPHDVIASLSEVLQDDRQSEVLFSGDSVYKSILDSFDKPKACFSTGYKSLDQTTAGGFYAGWTYGFCGAEKSGKTMLATSLAYNMTHSPNPAKILYIALEMGSQQIEQRSIARQLGFNSIKFFNDLDYIKPLMKDYIPNENITYLDLPGATLDEILLNVSKARVKHGIDGFIVDYWQLVRGGDSRTTEEKHLRDVAQGISDYARKNNLFNILLAQMNQDGKLFGGNGLKKACDQLYMIEQVEENDKARWLRMDASRYTLRANIGDEYSPGFMIDNVGPHLKETDYL